MALLAIADSSNPDDCSNTMVKRIRLRMNDGKDVCHTFGPSRLDPSCAL